MRGSRSERGTGKGDAVVPGGEDGEMGRWWDGARGNGDGVCWSWGERGGGVPIPGKKRDGVPRSLFRGKVGDAEPRSQGKRGMRCPGPGEKG